MVGPESKLGEFDLIARIREKTTTSSRVAFGIGDDCASIHWPDPADLLITTDMLMDGRHFKLGEATPEQVGYKCLAVNLSDIAAMAGRPVAAVVSVALPRHNAEEIARGLQQGISELAHKFAVDLVGGDTNVWDGPLVVNITLIGETTERGAVRRSGAKPGDSIFVTGPLGGSLSGRHLSPQPRIREALALHQRFPINAMIDLSDGLASDLAHILKESGNLGAILNANSIPIHVDASIMSSRDGKPALEHALTDGEDFELCFTLSPEAAIQLINGQDTNKPLAIPWPNPTTFDQASAFYLVGLVVDTPGLYVIDPSGRKSLWDKRGFDHLKS